MPDSSLRHKAALPKWSQDDTENQHNFSTKYFSLCFSVIIHEVKLLPWDLILHQLGRYLLGLIHVKSWHIYLERRVCSGLLMPVALMENAWCKMINSSLWALNITRIHSLWFLPCNTLLPPFPCSFSGREAMWGSNWLSFQHELCTSKSKSAALHLQKCFLTHSR